MKWSDLYWHRITPLHIFLWPLSLLYRLFLALRRQCYKLEWLPSSKLPVPVIVIDSISVEDSGKTPLVLWLVEFLQLRGLRPGIISQTPADSPGAPTEVTVFSDPTVVGGNSQLLAHRCGERCPVWVGHDRVAVAQALLAAHPQCNVLISNDGLQYHRLHRDLEIVVVNNSERSIGNGLILPAGPLRDSFERLNDVDAIVMDGRMRQSINTDGWANIYHMKLVNNNFYNLVNPESRVAPSVFSGKRLHAMAAFDNAQWFFDQLDYLGLAAELHTFAEHHRFVKKDIQFPDAEAILMTEEDAINYLAFADDTLWALPVGAWVDDTLGEGVILRKLMEEETVP